MATTDEFLDGVYRMKCDFLVKLNEAEARGDLKEARALEKSLAGMDSMIRQKGGDPAAERLG